MKKAAFDFAGKDFSDDFKTHFLSITRAPLGFYHRAYLLFGLVAVLFFFSLFKHALTWPAVSLTAVLLYQIARVRKAGAGLSAERKVSTGTAEQGSALRIEYKVKNNSAAWCPPFFIQDQTMYLALKPSVLAAPNGLAPGASTTLATSATVESPTGRTTMSAFCVRARDELGLFETVEYFEDEVALEVRHGHVQHKDVELIHPKNSLIPGDLEMAQVGQGINLLTIREYHDGDPMNKICWKHSTQDESIFVKEFESDIARRVAFVIDNRAHAHVGYGASSTWEVSKTIMTRLCGAYLKAQSSVSIISNEAPVKDLSGMRTFPFCERTITNLNLQYEPGPQPLALIERFIMPPCLILWIAPFDAGDVEDTLRQMTLLKARGYEPHVCFVDPTFSIALVAKKFGSFREEARKITIDHKQIERRFARAEIRVTWAHATQVHGGVEVSRHG